MKIYWIYKALDDDTSGDIDEDEWVLFQEAFCDTDYDLSFDDADTDGDGAVSVTEFESVLSDELDLDEYEES